MRTHIKKKGYALISSLVAVFIIGILTFSMLGVSIAGTHITGHRRDSQLAFDIADAGFQHAFRSLIENPSYTGQSNVTLGAGTFSVVVTPGVGSTVNVVSKGSVLGGEGVYATRTISGAINTSGLNSLLGYAVVSKGPISFSGSSNVTSSPTNGQGDVYSNSNVTMSGAVTINGKLTAAGTIKTSGNAHATGGEDQGASQVTFPSVNTSQMQALAAAYGTTNGSINAGSGQTKTIQGVINGNLSASGGGKFVLSGPVFVTGNVNLTGHSYSGNGTLFVQGNLTISGNSGASTPDTSNLAIVDLSSSTSAVVMTGGASVGGFIYCPNGTITMSGGANVFGGVATNSINFSGNVNVTRNMAQQPPTGIGTPSIAYWNDQTGT